MKAEHIKKSNNIKMGVHDTWSGSEKVWSSVYALVDGYSHMVTLSSPFDESSCPKYKDNVCDHTIKTQCLLKRIAIHIVLPSSGETHDILLEIRAAQHIIQFQQAKLQHHDKYIKLHFYATHTALKIFKNKSVHLCLPPHTWSAALQHM